jgi:hypothetical protein
MRGKSIIKISGNKKRIKTVSGIENERGLC